MAVLRDYLAKARPVLLDGRPDKGWIFPGVRRERMAQEAFRLLLGRAHGRAPRENPDLDGFADKRITPHCLRVTFAALPCPPGGAATAAGIGDG